jgi:hypothetical protein
MSMTDASRFKPSDVPLTWTRTPITRSANVATAPLRKKRVSAVVRTVWPATTSVAAAVVGGNDSTRPSSCVSLPWARRDDSSVASAPLQADGEGDALVTLHRRHRQVGIAAANCERQFKSPVGTFLNSNRLALFTVVVIAVP